MKIFIGLEVHLHVKTETKMFCRCKADIYGARPNTHTCPVCLGLPGALPVANLDAIKKTQLLGQALQSTLNADSRFDRKHYFYPDLPKGYQISQYKQPLCVGGHLELSNGWSANIERIHLEEDTAKSFHGNGKTLIDFNKSGMPLVEIVTTPTFHSAEDCEDFCKQIQNIIRTLDIGDGDMEKGQMRLEVNVSMRLDDKDELPDYKVEIKNINSFRFMKKAISSEITRQSKLLREGKTIVQENRGFNEATGETTSQRGKEHAHDYRYFPEPDLPPMYFDEEYFTELKKMTKETPSEIVTKYLGFGLTRQEADFFANFENKDVREIFDQLLKHRLDAKKIAKLLINKPETRNLSLAKFKEIITGAKDAISDESELTLVIQKLLGTNVEAVADFKKGKTNAIEFIVGQVMRETKGKADVSLVRQLIIKLIGS